MDPMDTIEDEYLNFWETSVFLHNEDLLDSWAMNEAFSGDYDSSSPDGGLSSTASKNIVSERNRRKKLNERLFALRSVVPNISKMDKASIIKDAIDYIQELNKRQRRIEAEILELESEKLVETTTTNTATTTNTVINNNINTNNGGFKYDHQEEEVLPAVLNFRSKKNMIEQVTSTFSPIEVLELRVAYMGQKTVLVSLTCSKTTEITAVRLCEVFESLKLKIITANITAVSGRILKTIFVEADEEEREHLRIKIETAIAALNDPQTERGSPMRI